MDVTYVEKSARKYSMNYRKIYAVDLADGVAAAIDIKVKEMEEEWEKESTAG